MKQKALLVRLDKIGDLICTLPTDQLPEFQDALHPVEVHWMISHGLDFIPRNTVPKRKYSCWRKKFQVMSFFHFLMFLRREKFDLAISFQAPWWVAFGVWLSGVPLRAGVKSQWHSFLFLNRGLRQRRSQATQHESAYNFDLVQFAFSPTKDGALSAKNTDKNTKNPILKMTPPKIWMKPHFLKKYFVVHPGMAGSALNWPQENYISTIEKIFAETDLSCVMTGLHMDEPYLIKIKQKLMTHPRFFNLQSQISAEELLDVIDHAEFVIAPSTGVLHLSASLGKKTLGLYSPLPVQHPRRWAARGPDVHIFCPPDNAATDPACMNLITPESVVLCLKG